MASKLNKLQWLYASVAVFIVYSLLTSLLNRLAFTPFSPELAGSTGDPLNIWVQRAFVYPGRFIFSLVFAYIFTRGYEGKSGVGEGIRYGLWVGIMVSVPPVSYALPHMMTVTAEPFIYLIRNLFILMACGTVLNVAYRQPGKSTAS
jgi:hypothetical protein